MTGQFATSTRTRDRHGRGMRGDLIPPHLPGYLSRRDRFDAAITDAMRPLLRRFGKKLEHVHVLVEEVPLDTYAAEGPVLGRYFPGDRRTPPKIFLYRRPIESRCSDREELNELVYIVVVENVAAALGIRPSAIDPWLFDN